MAWTGRDSITNYVGYRLYDAAGPELRSLRVPGTATAGAAAAFSVAPFDAFSAVAGTRWNFGDGATASGAAVQHAYAGPGTYTVTVTATDAAGNATSATRTIAVAAAPSPPPPPPPPGPPPVAKQCKVPKLKGLTQARAKQKLTAARCRLGKTIRPKKLRKAKGLVVKRQSRKPGAILKAGTKVNVTLGGRG
jgi:hypothetical protein